VTLGIRPEHIALSSQAAGGVPLNVQTLEILGADNLAHGRFGEQKVVVRLAHQHRPAAGSTLWLHVPPEHLHFFDGETGQRL
ncbi:TOBE domain-containing protein, partial [Escherichia coli]